MFSLLWYIALCYLSSLNKAFSVLKKPYYWNYYVSKKPKSHIYKISLKIRSYHYNSQVKMFSEFHLGKWSNLTRHKQIYRYFLCYALFLCISVYKKRLFFHKYLILLYKLRLTLLMNTFSLSSDAAFSFYRK